MTYRKKIDINPFNSLGSILIMILVFAGLFFIARGIFTILAWVAPLLLIATLVIDYKVVLGYGKWLVNLLKNNLGMGIGALLLTIFGFPVIAGFLFVKALLYRKVNKLQEEVQRRQEGELVDFEEVDSKPTIIELPPIKKKQKEVQNDYEQLFDEDL